MNDVLTLGVERRFMEHVEHHGLGRPDWVMDAACVKSDPSIFFDVGLETSSAKEVNPQNAYNRALAKYICRQCPVMEKCREYYLMEDHGVFGGLDRDERRALRAARHAEAKWTDKGRNVPAEVFERLRADRRATVPGLARQYGMRGPQLKALMEAWYQTPEGQRAQLGARIAHLVELNQGDVQIAMALGLTTAKVAHIRRTLGLIEQPVSLPPEKVTSDFHDGAVRVVGGVLPAVYLGESADDPPWYFMQIAYPHGTTRKWMPQDQVTLRSSVRRHVIQQAGVVPNGKRRTGQRRSPGRRPTGKAVA